MPAYSRRPEIVAAFQRILDRNYPDQAISAAVTQELIQAAEGRGVDFDRLAVAVDPVADDWLPGRTPEPATDRAAGPLAARRAWKSATGREVPGEEDG